MRRDESGIVLVEIVVSAMLLVIVALGVFAAFDVGTRSSAEERHRARAHSLAEADVARMESMRIADLASPLLNDTRTVNQDGLDYTINSRADFVKEDATTNTCASGTGSRDYVQVTSTVTWATIGGRPPVSVSRILPHGSTGANTGSLLVNVDDATGAGIPGVTLSGSGPGAFTGATGLTGCVMWRNLPVGNYTMSVSGAAAAMVDVNGDDPASRTVSVVAQSTNTVTLQYDTPGQIGGVTFRTKPYTGNALVPSLTESIVVDHTGMNTAKVFTAPGGIPEPTITTASTLFPFTSPYSVYAGSCGENNPGPGDGIGSATVPAGGTGSLADPGYITIPALHLRVLNNTNNGNSLAVAGATVKVRDVGCSDYLRTRTTDELGQLPNPGLPWGTHNVCVSGLAADGTIRHRTTGTGSSPDDPVLDNLNSGTNLVMFLRGGGSQSGACP